MKINTTWSQADWNNALKKVWTLAKDFEEILNFGLERGFITNLDIIHASDIYKDPNKEYDDEEVKEVISSRGLQETMEIIQNEYSLDEILETLPPDDLLDNISNDDMIDYLEGTWELDRYGDDIRAQCHSEILDEVLNEIKTDNENHIANIYNWSADELHHLICDIVGCAYYDNTVYDKLKERLNKNTYGVKYE